MGKKDLPAVDFHAVVARRDPALAERLAREGLSSASAEESTPPILAIVPPPAPEPMVTASAEPVIEHDELAGAPPSRPRATKPSKSTPVRKRGVVHRAGGREAGRVTVYVPTELALRLRQYCFTHDRTMTDVAGEVLVEALERRLRGS